MPGCGRDNLRHPDEFSRESEIIKKLKQSIQIDQAIYTEEEIFSSINKPDNIHRRRPITEEDLSIEDTKPSDLEWNFPETPKDWKGPVLSGQEKQLLIHHGQWFNADWVKPLLEQAALLQVTRADLQPFIDLALTTSFFKDFLTKTELVDCCNQPLRLKYPPPIKKAGTEPKKMLGASCPSAVESTLFRTGNPSWHIGPEG